MRIDLPASSPHPVLRPVRFCGEMCYSLYLVHWPVTTFVTHGLDALGVKGVWPVLAVTVPVATGLSIALASLFYQHVERRFLNAPATGEAGAPGVLSIPDPSPSRGP